MLVPAGLDLTQPRDALAEQIMAAAGYDRGAAEHGAAVLLGGVDERVD